MYFSFIFNFRNNRRTTFDDGMTEKVPHERIPINSALEMNIAGVRKPSLQYALSTQFIRGTVYLLSYFNR